VWVVEIHEEKVKWEMSWWSLTSTLHYYKFHSFVYVTISNPVLGISEYIYNQVKTKEHYTTRAYHIYMYKHVLCMG